MEIVRQRKKRLLAWILTLVLCVGMWQGNVQATEGDGVMPVADDAYLGLNDNVGEGRREFSNSVSYNADLSSITIPDGVTSFTVIAKNGNYEHSLLEWTMSSSGNTVVISGNTNTIAPEDGMGWIDYQELEIKWGPIIVLTDSDSNIIGVCKQEDSKDVEVSFSLPADVNEMNQKGIPLCKDGFFFSDWGAGMSGCTIENNTFVADFDQIYTSFSELQITNYDSTTVPASGTYELLGDITYTLGDNTGTWSVGNDGYTYTGGISFVGPGQSYTYTKNN